MREGSVYCVASKSQLATRSSLTLFPVPPQSARLREGLSWLPFKWPLGRRKGIKSCARGRTGPGGERGAAAVPTMIFLSRYVVGGVARNVQGNEHLALLPIPFQLPVVGAQEKEGREAGVIAHRRARPQRRPQQQRQEESLRGPATALHAAAAAAAARPERRSLIQFGRRRDGGATRREGEEAADASRAGSGAEPRSSAEDRGSQSFFGPRESETRAAGSESASSAASVRRRSRAASARRPSARPGKAPAPLHTFLKPRAPSLPPRRCHTCPGRSPAPTHRPARARPAPALSSSHARTSGDAGRTPPGAPAQQRASPPEGPPRGAIRRRVWVWGCCWGPRGPSIYSKGRRNLGEREPPASCLEEHKEKTVPFGPQISLFFLRGGAGEGEGWWGRRWRRLLCLRRLRPHAPRGSPASEPGRPALVLGIRPRPRTARGPCAPFPSRPRVPPAAPRPVPRRSDRASSVAGF